MITNEILLIFFAIPIAVVIISIALQKIFRNPILVAAIIFAIFFIKTIDKRLFLYYNKHIKNICLGDGFMNNRKYINIKKRSNKIIRENKVNILVVFVVLFFVFLISTNFSFGKNELRTKEIIVSENDTIWNISKDICNNSNDDLNIQFVVNKIKKINNLSNSDIYAGQVIKIPIY